MDIELRKKIALCEEKILHETSATPLGEIYCSGRKPTKDEEYDARMVHSGFGSPDCSCHVAPPCASCVAWCPTCKEHTYGACPEEHF